jgi:nicotinamide-nucleotide amidase
MLARILSIGEELLLGEIADTNAAYIARGLFDCGVEVRGIETAGDHQEYVADAIRRACDAADFLIITGGLGPTRDDITREALADVTGRNLEYHDRIMDHMAAVLGRDRAKLLDNQKRQAMVPQGAEVLDNRCGTAPGLWLEHDGTAIAVMPGVPFEMYAMFEEAVLPRIRERARVQGRLVQVRRYHVIGLPESEIDARLGELMDRGREVQVGTRVSRGMCMIRTRAEGAAEDGERLGRLLGDAEQRIRDVFGLHLFAEGEQTLPDVVVKAYSERGLTLSAAESCTGGRVAAAVTDVAGASAVLRQSWVVYSNEAKQSLLGVDAATLSRYGAVSAEVVQELAQRALERAAADVAVAISGIAGPGGGSPEKPVGLVWFGLARRGAAEVRTERRVFRGGRQAVRDRATTQALHLLWRAALDGADGGR